MMRLSTQICQLRQAMHETSECTLLWRCTRAAGPINNEKKCRAEKLQRDTEALRVGRLNGFHGQAVDAHACSMHHAHEGARAHVSCRGWIVQAVKVYGQEAVAAGCQHGKGCTAQPPADTRGFLSKSSTTKDLQLTNSCICFWRLMNLGLLCHAFLLQLARQVII